MKKLFDQYGRTILVIVVVAALILLTAVAKGPISNVVTGQITTLGDLGGEQLTHWTSVTPGCTRPMDHACIHGNN